MTLYGILFDHLIFSPFAVMVGCVRDNVYVLPCVFDDAVMHEAVKGIIFDFIGLGHTKNCILLCE